MFIKNQALPLLKMGFLKQTDYIGYLIVNLSRQIHDYFLRFFFTNDKNKNKNKKEPGTSFQVTIFVGTFDKNMA